MRRSGPPRGAASPREAAKRRALRALRRVQRLASRSEAELSDWEAQFLLSLEDRVRLYGRAFADPDKGAAAGALSLRQALKLRQIAAKAAEAARTDAAASSPSAVDGNEGVDEAEARPRPRPRASGGGRSGPGLRGGTRPGSPRRRP